MEIFLRPWNNFIVPKRLQMIIIPCFQNTEKDYILTCRFFLPSALRIETTGDDPLPSFGSPFRRFVFQPVSSHRATASFFFQMELLMSLMHGFIRNSFSYVTLSIFLCEWEVWSFIFCQCRVSAADQKHTVYHWHPADKRTKPILKICLFLQELPSNRVFAHFVFSQHLFNWQTHQNIRQLIVHTPKGTRCTAQYISWSFKSQIANTDSPRKSNQELCNSFDVPRQLLNEQVNKFNIKFGKAPWRVELLAFLNLFGVVSGWNYSWWLCKASLEKAIEEKSLSKQTGNFETLDANTVDTGLFLLHVDLPNQTIPALVFWQQT